MPQPVNEVVAMVVSTVAFTAATWDVALGATTGVMATQPGVVFTTAETDVAVVSAERMLQCSATVSMNVGVFAGLLCLLKQLWFPKVTEESQSVHKHEQFLFFCHISGANKTVLPSSDKTLTRLHHECQEKVRAHFLQKYIDDEDERFLRDLHVGFFFKFSSKNSHPLLKQHERTFLKRTWRSRFAQ